MCVCLALGQLHVEPYHDFIPATIQFVELISTPNLWRVF